MPLLPTNVTAGSSGHINHSNQAYGKLNDMPNVVRDYGAVPDGTTNCTSAIQAGIDAVANSAAAQGRGGTLYFPPGSYKTDQLTMKRAITLLGAGHPMKGGDARYGSVLSARANNQRIMLISDTTLAQEGFLIDSLGFDSSSFTGCTGIGIYNTNRFQLVNCTFNGNGGTPMAIGVLTSANDVGGPVSGDMAWWNIERCDFRRCLIGIQCNGNGGRIMGCNFVPDSTQSGEIGVWLRQSADSGSQSNHIIGCMFDIMTSTTSYGVVMEGNDCSVSYCKMEGYPPGTGNGTGVLVRRGVGAVTEPRRNNIIGNGFGGLGGSGAPVTITDSASDTGVFFNHTTNGTAAFVNNVSGVRVLNRFNRNSSAQWTTNEVITVIGEFLGAPPANGFRTVWRAPFACTVTAVLGQGDAGTQFTFNARKNKTSDFCSADRTTTPNGAWVGATVNQNQTLATGDDVEVELVGTSGAVTRVVIQVDILRSVITT